MTKKNSLPIASAFLFCSALVTVSLGSSARLNAGEVAVAAVPAKSNCRANQSGKKVRCFRKCPKCDADVCFLKCENTKVKKNCFDVDQKVVCIPRVTFPWQKCCNRCSKARTVNVLRVKEYECCECKYTWKLCEPELPKTPTQAPQQPSFESDETTESQLEPALKEDRPAFESEPLYDPSGSDVPAPPTTNRINQ